MWGLATFPRTAFRQEAVHSRMVASPGRPTSPNPGMAVAGANFCVARYPLIQRHVTLGSTSSMGGHELHGRLAEHR